MSRPAPPPILITGGGCTLPGSPSPAAFWQRWAQGRSAIMAYDNPRMVAAPLRCFGHVDEAQTAQATQAVPFKLRRYASVSSAWGMRAAREALAAADRGAAAPIEATPADRRAVFTAQGDYAHPSLPAFEHGVAAALQQQSLDLPTLTREFFHARGAEPFFAIQSLANNLLAMVSLGLHWTGDCGAFVQDDSAPSAALRSAVLSLRHGYSDVALVVCAGTHDEALTLAELQHHARLTAGAEGAPSLKPFDLRRDGMVPAEGAIAFVLETAAHAARRGARPLARLSGLASLVDPGDQAYEHCTRLAAEDARLPTSVLDAIVATGRGEREADAREMRLLAALPAPCATLPITTPTSITGSVPGCPLGLLGALQMLAAQQLPPIAHLDLPAAPALPFVSGAARPAPLDHLLVLEAGLLGSHSATLLSRCEP